tara:strand:+ start:82 stop:252 length:171 start_codon:yes stop_codon:yes gene_type:complete
MYNLKLGQNHIRAQISPRVATNTAIFARIFKVLLQFTGKEVHRESENQSCQQISRF